MKKVLTCTVSAVLFLSYSCNNSPTADHVNAMLDSPSTNNSMAEKEATQAEKNSANMRSVYKGIESGDMSMMDGFVADDIVDHDGPHGMAVKGRDSVKKMLGELHNHFTDMKFEVLSDASGGDFHFALVKFTGTTKDGKMGMPANTPISDTSVDVVRVVNGKAVEHWGFQRPHMPDKKADKRQ